MNDEAMMVNDGKFFCAELAFWCILLTPRPTWDTLQLAPFEAFHHLLSSVYPSVIPPLVSQQQHQTPPQDFLPFVLLIPSSWQLRPRRWDAWIGAGCFYNYPYRLVAAARHCLTGAACHSSRLAHTRMLTRRALVARQDNKLLLGVSLSPLITEGSRFLVSLCCIVGINAECSTAQAVNIQ